MAMTIVEGTRAITGGVDTHLEVHVAAALDPVGGLLGVKEFSTSRDGEHELLVWLAEFGPVERVGVEGTGSYGASLGRFLAAAGVPVVEVDRPNRQARHRRGKSDPVDAVEAARAAQGGRATGAAKSRDGNVEAIRALMVAKRSARSVRIKTLNPDPSPELHRTRRDPGPLQRHLVASRHRRRRRRAPPTPWW